jgi:hypothetical protein
MNNLPFKGFPRNLFLLDFFKLSSKFKTTALANIGIGFLGCYYFRSNLRGRANYKMQAIWRININSNKLVDMLPV